MGVHKYKYNWNFFNTDSEELYYFLGFVAADGYISENEIEIGVNIKDIKILEAFRDLIVPDKPIYTKSKTNSCTLKISCKKYIPRIKKFYSMTSNDKHKEMLYPNIPDMYQKDFIRGYVDGDGTIGITKGYRADKIYIGSCLRILGNVELQKKLNKKTKTAYNHKTNSIRKKKNENVYLVTYNFSTSKAILKWLYDNNKICLERKYNKYLEVTV